MAGKRWMDYFFSEEMNPESVINMTESSYSNNEVGLSYIKHFIEATESSPSSIKKFLLYDVEFQEAYILYSGTQPLYIDYNDKYYIVVKQ
jgi:hypothetical protein